MKRTMILSAVTAACLLSAAGQAQVVISQVYGGGGNSGSTYRNDFIELKNIGNTPVDLTGWSVQYASAAGSFAANLKTNLTSFVLQPGQYYLIQEAAQGGGTVDLPTPDVIGAPAIAMSASNAKVALVASTDVITGPTDANVRDLVGYGTANAFEGLGAAPGLSNTTAAQRNGNGCSDTNDNSADFTVTAPTPHNSTSIIACGAVFPDLTLQFSAVTCNPTAGSGYEVTAQLSNLLAQAADNSVVTLVLPPTFTYASSNTGGAGTASYNPATRTLTWNVGTVAASGSASITVSGTATGTGGLMVSAAVTTTTPNEPTGNNTAISYNEVLSTAAPLSVIAVGSFNDPTIATNVDENGTARQLGTIYRSFTSPNGEWIIFRTDLAGLPSETNGAVIVGRNVGGVWSFSLVAREGTTAPVAALPNARIDNSGVNNIQGINNAGQYVYSTILREVAEPNDILTDAIVKGTVAGGISSVIVEGDAAVAPELAGRNYVTLSSTTIQNDGSISFMATLTGTGATNAAFLRNNGSTVLAQKGVTIPTGSTLPFEVLDTDGSSDGRGLTVSADGTSWLGTGEVQTAGNTTTDDNVVVVNGAIVVREGSTVGSFAQPAGWATFGSQQIPWGQMTADGHWFVQGYNPLGGFNAGQDWVMRDGTVIAQTGGSIFGAETETWADNVLQRTFVVAAGQGDDYVLSGLTNRSAPANGSDDATDGVVTFRNSELLVREGTPVEVAPGDIRYINNINDHRSFIAGGSFYLATTLRNANSTCSRNFSNLPQAIVAIDLPDIEPPACVADIGIAGGLNGQDGLLDNNDFIAFINYFFAQNPIADMGIAGGLPGSDGQWDNNDFIAFINHFFAGCPN